MSHRRSLFRQISLMNIPEKANKVLNIILFSMLFIVMRIWHLTVVQYDERLERAQRPQRRLLIQSAERGSICDRFGIPLAVNRVCYNASIYYAHIRALPRVALVRDRKGRKKRVYKRKEHIECLSQRLGEELGMDPERIEDLIHSKAALFPNSPYVIKENLTEEEFFRLKFLERDLVGLRAERVPKRYYPHKERAAEIIGYMGAISREEYLAIANEKKTLESVLKKSNDGESVEFPEGIKSYEQAEKRLTALNERAYTINDRVGKTGIEEILDGELRGYYGKKIYYSDARGNFLKELSGGKPPIAGVQVKLTISNEMQELAEQLLIQNEEIRDGRSTTYDWKKKEMLSLKQPWIKGGAIVAMDPHTGELIAMATYPGFDPNDFISTRDPQLRKKKSSHIQRWFETESYLSDLWEGKQILERQRYSSTRDLIFEETRTLTWKQYLNFIAPESNQARQQIEKMATVENAVAFQRNIESLRQLFEVDDFYKLINILYPEPQNILHKGAMTSQEEKDIRLRIDSEKDYVAAVKVKLKPILGTVIHNYDKVLLADLTQVILDSNHFSDLLLEQVGQQSLEDYREASMAMAVIEDEVQEMLRVVFRGSDFRTWRKEHGKAFLKEQRRLEREENRYYKPYLDHFDAEERKIFKVFWQEYRLPLLIAFIKGEVSESEKTNEILKPYLDYLIAWEEELSQGAHAILDWNPHFERLRAAVAHLDLGLAYEYLGGLRRYKDLNRSLYGRYKNIRKERGPYLEKHLATAFYPQYGFGYARSYAYRQATPIGSIFKLVVAYESLLQEYMRLKEMGEVFVKLNPLEMIDVVQRVKRGRSAWLVGYDQLGQAIPQFYEGGRLPRSDKKNLGKLDIVKAIEVSSNPYFSLLASKVISDPEDLNAAAKSFSFGARTGIELPGEIKGNLPDDITRNKTGLYAYAIGQHSLVATPLQAAVMVSAFANGGRVLQPRILLNDEEKEERHRVFLPDEIREPILNGMYQAVNSSSGSARPTHIYNYYEYPYMLDDYKKMQRSIIGKTSTAEIMESIDLDLDEGVAKFKHIGFGAISFKEIDGEKSIFKDPELVVIVYLKYGNYGKEAAPIAAQMIKKWRDMKKASSEKRTF